MSFTDPNKKTTRTGKLPSIRQKRASKRNWLKFQLLAANGNLSSSLHEASRYGSITEAESHNIQQVLSSISDALGAWNLVSATMKHTDVGDELEIPPYSYYAYWPDGEYCEARLVETEYAHKSDDYKLLAVPNSEDTYKYLKKHSNSYDF